MPDPYQNLPVAVRRRLMVLVSLAAIVIMIVFGWLGAPLTTPAAPLGMVSFQLARTPQQWQAILASWEARTQLIVAFCLGADYLFMPVYALAITLADRWAGQALRQRGWPLASLGVPLVWGVWLAALLDAVENAGQTALLLGNAHPSLPGFIWIVAVLKYALVFIGLTYAFFGVAAWLVSGANARSSPA
jgi:hypothetical protein